MHSDTGIGEMGEQPQLITKAGAEAGRSARHGSNRFVKQGSERLSATGGKPTGGKPSKVPQQAPGQAPAPTGACGRVAATFKKGKETVANAAHDGMQVRLGAPRCPRRAVPSKRLQT